MGKQLLFLGIAGLVGTLTRYGLSGWLDRRFERLPLGTLAVNILGCFVAGYALQWMADRYAADSVVRLSVFTGFLGGFTTFSAYGVQSFLMIRSGDWMRAGLYALASNVLGIAAVWAGYKAGILYTIQLK